MRVHVDGVEIDVRGERRRMLLWALAARLGRQVSVDELAEVLWGDALPADPAGSVHALVSRLRKNLGSGGSALVTGWGYELEATAVRIDADEFVAAFEGAAAGDGRLEANVGERLRRALELWRGDPWGELPDDAVAVARAGSLAAVRRAALEILGSGWANGRGERADLVTLEAASAEFPFSEPIARGLALGREHSGRRVEALRGVSEFIGRVRSETGLDPSPEMLRLEARLIEGGAPPQDVTHRFAAGDVRRSDGLVGRDDEIAQLGADLRERRLVTVTGTGGVGKTALAQACLDFFAAGFPDGVYRCELAPIGSAEAIPFALAAALGLSPRSGLTPIEQAVEYLAQRSALVLFDNCEHLVADVAALVGHLVAACESLTVLATSREPLGVHQERRFDLGPLPVGNIGSEESDSSFASELFLRRVRDAGGEVPGSGSEEVAEICAALGGLPLALEIAASRCRSMTILELAEAIRSDMAVVRDARSRRPERHRDLEAVIGWSHDSLTPAARRVFLAASVFAGGFDRPAVSWVADPDLSTVAVDDAIDELVDKSLVHVDRHGRRARLSMLEPIRQFALRRLERTGAADSTRDAQLAFCRHTARVVADHIAGPLEADGVALARRELANLRAGHQHAVATAQVEAAMELIACLHDFAIWRENYEVGSWAEQVLALTGATNHSSAPIVCATAGWGFNKAGRYEEAVRLAETGLLQEERGGDATGWCHDVLAHTAYWTGDLETAVGWANDEVERAGAAGDALRVAYMLGDLAAHSAAHGSVDVDFEIQRNRNAVDLAEAAGVPSVLAFTLHALGASLRLQDGVEAESVLERSLEIAERVDCRFVLTASSQHLAAIHCSRGDWSAAVDALVPTLQRFSRGADPAHVGMVARVLVAPLDSLLVGHDAADTLIEVAGYGRATPGPRIYDIDSRNDELITRWHDDAGVEAVTDLMERGSSLSASTVVARLSDLASIVHRVNVEGESA